MNAFGHLMSESLPGLQISWRRSTNARSQIFRQAR
jgi:hypothetical protein